MFYEMMKIEGPIPPLSEQSVIAHFLDQDSHDDRRRKLRDQERLIELLKEKRQVLTTHVIDQGSLPERADEALRRRMAR